MAYQDLGPLTILGSSDALWQVSPLKLGTGWDVIVSASTSKLPGSLGAWPVQNDFEVYQMSIDGPVGSSLLVMRNRTPWNYVQQGWQNWWDPQQPLPLRNGDELQFCWSVPFTAGPYTPSGGANVRATVTLWLRYQIPLSAQI